MAIDIREIRVHEVDGAVAFAKEHGCDTPADAVIAALSLLAADGEQTVGVLLAVTGEEGGHEMKIALADPANQTLSKTLLDTALLKMRSRHINTSRIRFAGSDDDASALWAATNWTPGAIAPTPAPGSTPANNPGEQAA